MRLFRFDREVAVPIAQFDSHGVAIGRLVRFEGDAQIGCFHIDASGVVGFHQATVPQLFLCIAGAGWVRGSEEQHTAIRPGEAAFWEAGEWHESGSVNGMTAIVVEGTHVDPERYMPEIFRDG